MNKTDAEEFTASLGQSVSAAWRLIALAQRLKVPEALGLSVDRWVNDHLGGYVKLSMEDRRKAAVELREEGGSTREIAKVLGVDQKTVVNDMHREENSSPDDEASHKNKANKTSAEENSSPSPVDAVAALAVAPAGGICLLTAVSGTIHNSLNGVNGRGGMDSRGVIPAGYWPALSGL